MKYQEYVRARRAVNFNMFKELPNEDKKLDVSLVEFKTHDYN